MKIKISLFFFFLTSSICLFSQSKRKIIEKRLVTVDRLNFRPKPTRNSIRKKLLYKNDIIEILNIPIKEHEMTDHDITAGFYIKAVHENDTGYVHNHYVSRKGIMEIHNPEKDDFIWIQPGEHLSLPSSKQMQWYAFSKNHEFEEMIKIKQPPIKINKASGTLRYFYEPNVNATLIATTKDFSVDTKMYAWCTIKDFWKNHKNYDLITPTSIEKKYKLNYSEQNKKLLFQQFGENGKLDKQVDLLIFVEYNKRWNWFSEIQWYGDLNKDDIPDFLLVFCNEENCFQKLLLSIEPMIYKQIQVLSGELYYEDY